MERKGQPRDCNDYQVFSDYKVRDQIMAEPPGALPIWGVVDFRYKIHY